MKQQLPYLKIYSSKLFAALAVLLLLSFESLAQAPTITSVSVVSRTQIDVGWNEDLVSLKTFAAADYTLVINSSSVTVTGASIDTDILSITFADIGSDFVDDGNSSLGLAIAVVTGSADPSAAISNETVFDGIAPQFVSATTVSTTKIEVQFSEDVQNPQQSDFSATGLTISSADVKGGDASIIELTVSTIGTGYTASNLAIDNSGVQDLASNDYVATTGDNISDGVKPVFVSAKSNSTTEIEVVFSESISTSDDSKFDSGDNDFTVTGSSESGSSVLLTVTGVGVNEHDMDLDIASGAVTDQNSNTNDTDNNKNVKDGIAPLFISVTAEAKDKIRVIFNENIGSTVDKTKFTASGLPTVNTAVRENNVEVLLTLLSNVATDYSPTDFAIAAGAVEDNHGVAYAGSTSHTVVDDIKPEFVSAITEAPDKIIITFSEPIKSPNQNEFKTSLNETGVAVDSDNTKVVLTVSDLTNGYSGNLDLDASAVLDLSDNSNANDDSNQIDDGIAPSFVSAELINSTTVRVNFDEDVKSPDDSKFSATGITITSASATGSDTYIDLIVNPVSTDYTASDLALTAGAVLDLGNNPVGASSSNNITDNAKPEFVSAITQAPDKIIITFSEPIKSPNQTEIKTSLTETGVAVDGDNTKVVLTVSNMTSGFSGNLDLDGGAVLDLNDLANANDNTNPILDGIVPSLLTASVEEGDRNRIVLDFNENMNLADGDATGFSLNGTSLTISSAATSGSEVRLELSGNVTAGEVITIDYNDPNNVEDDNGNDFGNLVTQAVDNNVRPRVISAVVENADPTIVVVTFDAVMTANRNGFGIQDENSPSISISSATGSPGSIINFNMNRALTVTEDVDLTYSRSSGTTIGSNSIELNTTDIDIINNVAAIPEPSEHVTAFTATEITTSSVRLNWTDAVGPQLPGKYLIVGIDNLKASFPTISDDTSYPNDADWSDGIWYHNDTLGVITKPYDITGIESGRQYTFRMYVYTNQLADSDYKLDGTIPEDGVTLGVASNSLIANGSGVTNLSSIQDSKADALAGDVSFSFDFQDDGATAASDLAPTYIEQIIINRGTNDQSGGWTNYIAGVVINRDTYFLNSDDQSAQFTIADDQITITGLSTSPTPLATDIGYVADDATETFNIKVWLRDDFAANGIDIDNKNLVFEVANTDITVKTAAFPKSSLVAASSAASGDANNNIDVIASKLYWKDFSGFSTAHTNFNVTVQATDVNNNRDFDRTGLVTMVETIAPTDGYFESEGFPNDTDENLVMGQFTRTDMQVHLPGSYTIKATLSPLADGLTGPHIFINGDSQSDLIISSFDPPDNIDYHLFQESTIPANGTGAIKIAEFIVRDGGTIRPSFDADGAPTTLTDITFDIANHENIRTVAIHDGTSIVAQKPGNASVSFSSLTIDAADNTDASFGVYVSFNSNVDDNESIQLLVTAAESSGSTFAIGNAGGAITSIVDDNNKVEVTAIDLDWITSPRNVEGRNQAIQAPLVHARDANDNLDLDFNFAAAVSSVSANITGAPLNFSLGVLTFPSLQYLSSGLGTLNVVANGLSSLSSQVDVIHLNATSLDLEVQNNVLSFNNGITTDNPLPSGGSDKVVFGAKITAEHTTPGYPVLDELIIQLGADYSSAVDAATFVVYRSTNDSWENTDEIVNRVAGSTFVTVNGLNHDFSTDGPLNIFLKLDVRPEATGSNPPITGTLNGADYVVNSNISYSNDPSAFWRTYTFKDADAPKLLSQFPVDGEFNYQSGTVPFGLPEQQPTIELTFNETVFTADRVLSIYELNTQTWVADLTVPIGEDVGEVFKFKAYTESLPGLYEAILQPETWYYAVVQPGVDPQDNSAPHIAGFRDLAANGGNSFPGIAPLEWRFRTADITPPVFNSPSEVVNITTLGADLKVSLDEPGKLYYIVIPTGNTLDPTPSQIFIPNSYADTKVLFGTIDINEPSIYNYISLLDNAYNDNGNYEVHFIAEDLGGVQMSTGQFISFQTSNPTPGSGLVVNTPSQSICFGDYQNLYPPLTITERANGDFPNANNQKFNIALPSGYEFDIAASTVSVTYNSGNITSATPTFINNTLLEIRFSTNNTNARDVLTITGLQLKATGNAIPNTGSIVRSGGSSLLANDELPDGMVLGIISTSTIPTVGFDLSTGSTLFGNNEPPVTLIPNVELSDFGTNIFSGPGVVGTELLPDIAGPGLHDILLTHTTVEGCVSESIVEVEIFDNENAIGGISPSYCSDDALSFIPSNGKENHVLISLTIDDYILEYNENDISLYTDNGILDIVRFKNARIAIDNNYQNVLIPASLEQVGAEYNFYPDRLYDSTFLADYINLPAEGRLLGTIFFSAEYRNQITNDIVTFRQNSKHYITPTSELILNGTSDVDGLNFCEDTGVIQMTGTTPGGNSRGYYSLTIDNFGWNDLGNLVELGIVDASDGSATLDTQVLFDSLSLVYQDSLMAAQNRGEALGWAIDTIKVNYTLESTVSGCSSTTTQIIRLNPTLITELAFLGPVCEKTNLNLITRSYYTSQDSSFVSKLDTVNTILWDSDNGLFPITNNNDSVTIFYNERGKDDLSVEAWTENGCYSEATDEEVIVGGQPIADFVMSGVSLRDTVRLRSISTVLPSQAGADESIDSVAWSMDGGLIYTVGSNDLDIVNPNDSTHEFNYTASGYYEVKFIAISTNGCLDSLTRPVVMLDTIGIDKINSSNNYDQEFEDSEHGWKTFPETKDIPNWEFKSNTSWELGTTTSKFDNPTSNIWGTSLTDKYQSEEQSYVYSPTFDLSELDRPMIAIDIYKQLDTQDGVLFQYSTDSLNILDPKKEWHALGEADEGVNWFNAVGLSGQPGTNDTGIGNDTGLGWAEDNVNPEFDATWITSKHDLGEIYGGQDRVAIMSRVNFRIGLGAIERELGKEGDGFAFDNVFMGNRTRTVLLEAFTSMNGTSENKDQNSQINELVNAPSGAELVLLTYHTSFDGEDLLNLANPSQNGARALYYGISKNHRVALDGYTNPFNNTQSNILFEDWTEKFYSQRTLQIAPFDMTITLSEENNKLKINTEITATIDIEKDLVVHTVIIADSISTEDLFGPGEPVNSGEDYFKGTMLQMLPGAAGEKLINGLVDEATVLLENIWDPYDVINPSSQGSIDDSLSVVVFIQDEVTKEVYQAAYKRIPTDPNGLNLVLGAEDLISDADISLYPNPADQRITIALKRPLNLSQTALIHDNTGKVLEEIQLNPGQDRIELSTINYLSGIYLFSLPTDNGTVIKRFVISHR